MVRHCYGESCIVYLLVTMTLSSSFSGWVDPDTKDEHKKMTSYTDGKSYDLIMSDEFNREGRSFKDGDDPMWTGTLLNYFLASLFFLFLLQSYLSDCISCCPSFCLSYTMFSLAFYSISLLLLALSLPIIIIIIHLLLDFCLCSYQVLTNLMTIKLPQGEDHYNSITHHK